MKMTIDEQNKELGLAAQQQSSLLNASSARGSAKKENRFGLNMPSRGFNIFSRPEKSKIGGSATASAVDDDDDDDDDDSIILSIQQHHG